MSDDHPKQRSEADAQLEREIRADRKFSLSEAIGRMAGPGGMKGASPVDRRKQAAAEIEAYLDEHLADAPGACRCVLLRQVAECDGLLKDLDHPMAVLANCVRQLLDSECNLKELVREADVEWGQTFDERPRFERDGCPAAADDPYTFESVRVALTRLAGDLNAGQA
jgi:hypothetical protein